MSTLRVHKIKRILLTFTKISCVMDIENLILSFQFRQSLWVCGVGINKNGILFLLACEPFTQILCWGWFNLHGICNRMIEARLMFISQELESHFLYEFLFQWVAIRGSCQTYDLKFRRTSLHLIHDLSPSHRVIKHQLVTFIYENKIICLDWINFRKLQCINNLKSHFLVINDCFISFLITLKKVCVIENQVNCTFVTCGVLAKM